MNYIAISMIRQISENSKWTNDQPKLMKMKTSMQKWIKINTWRFDVAAVDVMCEIRYDMMMVEPVVVIAMNISFIVIK